LLEQTFIHIQGIGPKMERAIWDRGIFTWEDFLHHSGTILSESRDRIVRQELYRSIANRARIDYFCPRLNPAERWRLFEAFRHRAAYLDIETGGGYDGVEEITVIGLFDGTRVHTFVQGISLESFEIAVAEYDLLITFNGGPFDLPMIRRRFPGITLPVGHIDLRFLLRRLGLKGGLKNIEQTLGLAREKGIHGLNGWDAVRLWAQYREKGDTWALDRLIRYNTADIVNLEPLMEMGVHTMKQRLFHGLPISGNTS
jgi:uncharacterized protein YprB with RNaseH-like and TPR domain